MKKILILYSNYSPTIDAIIYRLNNIGVIETATNTENVILDSYDLVVLCEYSGMCNYNAINIHYSLLPSFINANDPIKEAIIEGVKVTGLTIFYTNPYRIITQYPLFIQNDMHYNELKQEIKYLEQVIYPIVIEKILTNKPFDIRNILSNKCTGKCKGCNGCKD